GPEEGGSPDRFWCRRWPRGVREADEAVLCTDASRPVQASLKRFSDRLGRNIPEGYPGMVRRPTEVLVARSRRGWYWLKPPKSVEMSGKTGNDATPVGKRQQVDRRPGPVSKEGPNA